VIDIALRLDYEKGTKRIGMCSVVCLVRPMLPALVCMAIQKSLGLSAEFGKIDV